MSDFEWVEDEAAAMLLREWRVRAIAAAEERDRLRAKVARFEQIVAKYEAGLREIARHKDVKWYDAAESARAVLDQGGES